MKMFKAKTSIYLYTYRYILELQEMAKSWSNYQECRYVTYFSVISLPAYDVK